MNTAVKSPTRRSKVRKTDKSEGRSSIANAGASTQRPIIIQHGVMVNASVNEPVSKVFGAVLNSDCKQLDSYIRNGIKSVLIKDLAKKLQLTDKTVADFVGLSQATLMRSVKADGTLDVGQSDRAVRLSRIWKQAVELWGNEQAAQEWLTNPERSLGGETPFEHARTEVGARLVEDLMGQIAYGISP